MATQKTYVPKSGGERKRFDNGGEIIKTWFDAEELIAFVREHARDGRIRLTIAERREVGKHGETHAIFLDDWTPGGAR
jgi:hypothetical protein